MTTKEAIAAVKEEFPSAQCCEEGWGKHKVYVGKVQCVLPHRSAPPTLQRIMESEPQKTRSLAWKLAASLLTDAHLPEESNVT
jgi:hypothetical protein